ncbi:hypothetical protein O0I10_012332 [Lichtheimia ornata]|uniref:Alkyl hydroperoxide reductase subunit C/ Thiol specific antioxidant domain-containing protein n=1 Tax=Lichtheimia ornata TaxID=688661 RepID=A0AAD7XT58_9FUNG|nr:uncharacterized protein O0I10_012332 [Lichtheimia ornata]KAJ8652058.1 hypothetical protein O0I10_012332 [Lichtheimia ornata]
MSKHNEIFEDPVSKRTRHDTAIEPIGDIGWNPLLIRDNTAMVAPDFNCSAVVKGGEINRFQLSSYATNHKALVLFFIGSNLIDPRVQMDLDLISNHLDRLEALQTLPLAMSTAPIESMQDTCNVGYPLLSDITRSVSRYFNVLDAANGSAKRAAFILDPRRRIRYSFMLGDDRINHSINTIITLLQSVVMAG